MEVAEPKRKRKLPLTALEQQQRWEAANSIRIAQLQHSIRHDAVSDINRKIDAFVQQKKYEEAAVLRKCRDMKARKK